MSKCTHEWTSRSGRCLHCKAVTVSPSQQADRIATLERELAAATAERRCRLVPGPHPPTGTPGDGKR